MREDVLELLKEEFPDIDFEASERLVDDGILDSVTLVEMISIFGTELDINIPYEEIVPENFNSVDAIADMLERLE